MEQFDLQPTLRGELLYLRPLQAEDFESLFGVSSDPLIWEMHPERYRYQREVFERFFSAAVESRGSLVALDAKTNEVIGSSRYTNYDPGKRSVEVGYTFLARRCWSYGYNKEMKTLMLRHAFEHVDLVTFFIGEKNLRSRRAIEKIGARLLEIQKRQPKEGAEYESAVYGIEKAAFLAGPLLLD